MDWWTNFCLKAYWIYYIFAQPKIVILDDVVCAFSVLVSLAWFSFLILGASDDESHDGADLPLQMYKHDANCQ